MKKNRRKQIVMALLFSSISMLWALDGNETLRWGIFIGANDGGPGLETLLYADDDAMVMAETLRDLGGLSPRNVEILIDPHPDAILQSLDNLQAEFLQQAPGVKKELIFYYSGHSDDEGMILGNEKLYYADVKKRLNMLNADVTVAVLDSCSSGAFTRAKGGVHRAPFMLDDSVKTEGHAYLTSSSASEISQESDLIGGSFFTYFLIAGLRGAADSNNDGRVTLNEVYQHTYNETINRTLETGGVQHPTYEINLSGSGDLVMTDLNQPSSILMLDRTLEGQLFIKNSEGMLILEMNKPLGQDYPLALPAGEYTLQVVHSTGMMKSAPIVLTENASLTIGPMDLQVQGLETARARGEQVEEEDNDIIRIESRHGTIVIDRSGIHVNRLQETNAENTVINADSEVEVEMDENSPLYKQNQYRVKDYEVVPFCLTFVPGIATVDIENKVVNTELAFLGSADAVQGLQLGYLGAISRDYSNSVQYGSFFAIAKKSMTGVQISDVFCRISGDMAGAQVSGGVSLLSGHLEGAQISGLLNLSGSVEGVQISGLGNIVKGDVEGIQLSPLFNKAEGNVKGMQIGLINIANNIDGIPIGLVNLYREGITTLGFWQEIDGGEQVYYSVMTGSDRLYSHFFMGGSQYDFWETPEDIAYGFGLGVRVPVLGGIKLDTDVNLKFYQDKLSAIGNDVYIYHNPYTGEEEVDFELAAEDLWGDGINLLLRSVLTTDWKVQPYIGATVELKQAYLLEGDPYSYITEGMNGYGFAGRFIAGLRVDFF